MSQSEQLSAFLKELRLGIDPDSKMLGTCVRLPSRYGRPVTQEEMAECIGVSRVWYATLESHTTVRTSPALLDRIAEVLMLTHEQRATLFNLALPELKLETPLTTPAAPYAAMINSPANIEEAAHAFCILREQYLHTGTAGESSLRRRIVNSWSRCLTSEVDSEKKQAPYCRDIAERRAANEKLLTAADSIASYLASEFAETGYVIFLADAEGNLLRTVGDLGNKREFSKHGIEEGCDLSEPAFGTNAVGTAIVDRRPMQLLSAEHFCEGASWFVCNAAPIYIPGEHEVAGVIDLSACYKCARPQALDVVMHAALEIEETLASL